MHENRGWMVWSEEGFDKKGREKFSVCEVEDRNDPYNENLDGKHVCIATARSKEFAELIAREHNATLAVPEQTELRERLEAALDKFIPICGGCSTHFNAEHRKGILDAIMPILAALPLLPQPAAPGEARVREWAEKWLTKHSRLGSIKKHVTPGIFAMLTDFAKSFPPSETNPVLIDAIKYALEWLPDADETHTDDHRIENFKFVKVLSEAVTNSLPSRSSRNDASQSGPPREIPLALSRDEIVKRGDDKSCQGHRRNLPMSSINPLYHCNPDDMSDVCRCTAIGSAIYELILEAGGAKP